MAGFARDDDARAFESAAAELRDLGVRIVATSASIAEDAAWLRESESRALGDAIHLATARAAGASAFVTNDAEEAEEAVVPARTGDRGVKRFDPHPWRRA